MSNEINLVTGKTFSLEKRIKQTKILRIAAIASMIIVVLVSVVLFLITIALPISSVKKDQQNTLSSLSLLHKKHIAYSLVANRISGIKTVTASRKDYAKTLNEIIKRVPDSLVVESMNVDSGKIEVGVSGSSLMDIDKLISDLISLNNNKKFIKNLLIENLVLNAQNAKVTISFQADML